MSVLDFPVQKASNITRTLRASVAAVASPFTGGQQVQDWGGEWWEYQIDMAVLRAVDGRSLSAFLAQLGGQRGRFLFRDPTIRNTASVGAPVVSGAGQAGNALVTSGWDLARDRRNLLTHTETFDTGPWSKDNVEILPNSTVSPNGSNTAAYMRENTTSSVKVLRPWNKSVKAGVRYTISIYIKAASTGRYVNIIASAGIWGTEMRASFDPATGAIDPWSASVAAGMEFSCDPAGGGWYRLRVSATCVGDYTGNFLFQVLLTNQFKSFAVSHLGDGTSGVYIWGAQMEEGGLTDYQPIPSPVMYAGDFISIGTGADTRLHQLTADVTPDNSGNATLQIVPRLRPSPADGAVIETANPAVLLRATGPVPTAIDATHHYRVSLTAREAL